MEADAPDIEVEVLDLPSDLELADGGLAIKWETGRYVDYSPRRFIGHCLVRLGWAVLRDRPHWRAPEDWPAIRWLPRPSLEYTWLRLPSALRPVGLSPGDERPQG